MKFEVFSRSKFINGEHPGDDAVLFMPGILAAVLDGATDPIGGQINGQSPGQFAARSVARTCAKLFLDPCNLSLSGTTILKMVADELAKNIDKMGFSGAPSTTLALTLFLPDALRILTIGDSGVRLNGDKVYRHCKLIDDVSASARVAVFSKLQSRITDLSQLEYTTRSVAFLGMEEAVGKGVLSLAESREIIAATQTEFKQHLIDRDIADFLEKGIKSQNRFANLAGHPLGFSTLNGDTPSFDDITDISVDIGEVQTLELFTDGYSSIPKGRSVVDWEATHQQVEETDFHKTGAFRCVKGSTKTEIFDDRSVISIRL